MNTIDISPSRVTSPATTSAVWVVTMNSPASICFEWRIYRLAPSTVIKIPVKTMMIDIPRTRGRPRMTTSKNLAAARPRPIKEIPVRSQARHILSFARWVLARLSSAVRCCRSSRFNVSCSFYATPYTHSKDTFWVIILAATTPIRS